MSRTEKLYQRQDSLEAEFRQLLIAEFACVAEGGYSHFLYRRCAFVPEGRSQRSSQVAHLEELEEEIAQLRGKLGSAGTLNLSKYVQDFEAEYEAAGHKYTGEWFNGRGEHVARRILEELLLKSPA